MECLLCVTPDNFTHQWDNNLYIDCNYMNTQHPNIRFTIISVPVVLVHNHFLINSYFIVSQKNVQWFTN